MTLTRRFATVVVDHQRWVVALWVIVAAMLMPLASKVEQRLEVAATIKGSESARVDQLLAQHVLQPERYPVQPRVLLAGRAVHVLL